MTEHTSAITERILNRKQLPNAPYFVRAVDTFLSNWGPAEELQNLLLLACNTYEEALNVAKYVKSREEMKYVRIIKHTTAREIAFPFFYVQCKTRAEYPNWYTSAPLKKVNREYEGWHNYETWNYVLWLDNDHAKYTEMLDALQKRKSKVSNAYARQILRNVIGTSTPDKARLVHVKLSEVADHLEQKRLELRAV